MEEMTEVSADTCSVASTDSIAVDAVRSENRQ
jgi:hypothetical protein